MLWNSVLPFFFFFNETDMNVLTQRNLEDIWQCSAACRPRQGDCRSDGSALYPDRGGGCRTVSICPNPQDCTLERMNSTLENCTHTDDVCVCSLAQSYPALCDPMDCIAHQAPLSMGFPRQECWSGLLFPSPGDLPHPGIEPRSPTLQEDSLPAEPPGKPKNTGVGGLPLLQGSSQPRNRTGVSCIAGGFFTNWATREACSIGRFFTVWATRKVHIDDVIIYSSINKLYLHEPNMTILRKSL